VSKAQAKELPRPILRFDVHQRLRHGMMATSVILLALTGWPLAVHSVGASQAISDFFGGVHGLGIAHRVGGVLLIAASLYHLAYLAVKAKQGKGLPLSMIPTPQDGIQAAQNVMYFLGLRKERPHFGKFTYFEKFDYWAVFWGVMVMGLSGLVRWFPDATTTVLPAWAYEIAQFAHKDEALLASLALFVWHFYNVHLRPGIFPMSKVFLNGRLTLAQLKHEHPAQYEELEAKGFEGVIE